MFLKFCGLFIIIGFILNSSHSIAQRVNFTNLNQLLAQELDGFDDINYINLMPQYSSDVNEANAVSLDIFSGEIDNSELGGNKTQWLRNYLLQEFTENPNGKIEIVAISLPDENLSLDSDISDFVRHIRTSNSRILYENIPPGLSISQNRHFDTTSINNKKQKRIPSSISERIKWTLIRGALNGGGATVVYISKDADPTTTLIMGLTTGIASGALTYFSATYNDFLNKGRFTRWLFDSEDRVARQFRRTLNLNLSNFAEFMQREERLFRQTYPNLSVHEFRDIIESSANQSINMTRERRARLLPKLLKVEELFMWWATDVVFYLTFTKTPQFLINYVPYNGVMNALASATSAGTMGFASQGPGELGIFTKKRTMIENLRADVIAGRLQVENSTSLLAEIERVLATSGPDARYVIHDGSHPSLLRIENWSRSRMTAMSFFAVTGVIMETAGNIPIAIPYLISVSSGGAFYYARANNLFNLDTRMQRMSERLSNIRRRLSPLQNYITRFCTHPFRKK